MKIDFEIPSRAKTFSNDSSVIPVVSHTKINHLPTKDVLDAELKLAEDKRLFHHVAALGDVHKKKDISNPTSSVAVSENFIMPQLFDSAPNCGMRIIKTDLTDEEVEKVGLDNIFETLLKALPTQALIGHSIPKKISEQSFIEGSAPVAEHLNVRVKNEISNTYEDANLFNKLDDEFKLKNSEELSEVISNMTVRLGKRRLGIMGATSSHFLMLCKVSELLDESSANTAGLNKNQYVFFMHTGSGIIGRLLGYLYSPQARSSIQSAELELLKVGYKNEDYSTVQKMLDEAKASGKLVGFDHDTIAGKMAVKTLQAAGNQGFANKTVLTHMLDMELEKIFKRQVSLDLLYDAPHILLSREKHYGKDVWVHRNGATRAYGPSAMSDHSTFKSTGEPAFLAPLADTFGYIAFGMDSNKSTFYSAAHELGKLKHLPPEVFNEISSKKDFSLGTVRKYTKQGVELIDPSNTHANFGKTLAEEMEDNQSLKLGARITPVAYLTHTHA